MTRALDLLNEQKLIRGNKKFRQGFIGAPVVVGGCSNKQQVPLLDPSLRWGELDPYMGWEQGCVQGSGWKCCFSGLPIPFLVFVGRGHAEYPAFATDSSEAAVFFFFFYLVGDEWVKVAQLCLILCDAMDCTVHGILQARILEWVSRSLLQGKLKGQTQVSCIEGRFFFFFKFIS